MQTDRNKNAQAYRKRQRISLSRNRVFVSIRM